MTMWFVLSFHSVGSYQTYGNNIAASAAFMAFNWEHAGSSLAVLPLDDCGRKSKNMPLLHGHTDTVTDLHFSPFHDGLLATGSQDCLVCTFNLISKIVILELCSINVLLFILMFYLKRKQWSINHQLSETKFSMNFQLSKNYLYFNIRSK